MTNLYNDLYVSDSVLRVLQNQRNLRLSHFKLFKCLLSLKQSKIPSPQQSTRPCVPALATSLTYLFYYQKDKPMFLVDHLSLLECKLGESGDFVLFILFLVANAVPSTQWVQDKYLLKEGNYTELGTMNKHGLVGTQSRK